VSGGLQKPRVTGFCQGRPGWISAAFLRFRGCFCCIFGACGVLEPIRARSLSPAIPSHLASPRPPPVPQPHRDPIGGLPLVMAEPPPLQQAGGTASLPLNGPILCVPGLLDRLFGLEAVGAPRRRLIYHWVSHVRSRPIGEAGTGAGGPAPGASGAADDSAPTR
jgi:hypothetical protein